MSWEALDLALALHAHPQRTAETRARSLPAGITQVLRLALEHQATLDDAVATTGLPAAQLIEAARFFVEQQMLARECQDDPWRVLGVAAGSDVNPIREHHRLLMRLVHPDRGDEWALAYADRVNKAWRQLRHEDGRAQAMAQSSQAAEDVGQARAAYPSDPPPGDPWSIPSDRAPVPRTAERTMSAPTLREPRPNSGSSINLLVIAAVAVVAIAGGFWLGVQRGQTQDAPSAIALDAEPSDEQASDARAMEEPSNTQPISADAARPAAGDTAPIAEPDPAIVDEVAAAPAAETDIASAAADPSPPPAPPAATTNTQTPSTATNSARASPPAAVVRAAKPSPSKPPRVAPAPREVAPTAVAASEAAVSPAKASVAATDDAVVEPIAATPASDSAEAEAIVGPTQAEADALLDQYQRRYAEGDLSGVLGLFAREVHAEDRRVAAIAKYYAHLFDTTHDRVIAVHDLRWRRNGERMIGSGQFQARFRPKNKLRYETIIGAIELELVSDAGHSRLLRLDAKPGKRS